LRRQVPETGKEAQLDVSRAGRLAHEQAAGAEVRCGWRIRVEVAYRLGRLAHELRLARTAGPRGAFIGQVDARAQPREQQSLADFRLESGGVALRLQVDADHARGARQVQFSASICTNTLLPSCLVGNVRSGTLTGPPLGLPVRMQ